MKRTLGPSTGACAAALRSRPGARDPLGARAQQRARLALTLSWARTRRPLAHAGRAA